MIGGATTGAGSSVSGWNVNAGSSPSRNLARSWRCSMPMTGRSETSRTSSTDAAATTNPSAPVRAANSASATIPLTGRTEPSSASSPAIGHASSRRPPSTSDLSRPEHASTPAAIGKSYTGPSFRRSAGARLTVSRDRGHVNPALRMAVRTRSADSRTAASGKPTIPIVGSPCPERSTSMQQGSARPP